MLQPDDLDLFTIPPEAVAARFVELERQVLAVDVTAVADVQEEDGLAMAQVLKDNLRLASDVNRLYCQILQAHAKVELRRKQAEGRYQMLAHRLMLTQRFCALGLTVPADKIVKAKQLLEQQRREECAPAIPVDIEVVLAELKALELMWKYLSKSASSTLRVVKQADMVAKKLFGARTTDTGGYVASSPRTLPLMADIMAGANLDGEDDEDQATTE